MDYDKRHSLRELAKNATPGWGVIHIAFCDEGYSTLHVDVEKPATHSDLKYINVANPQTIIALLDYIDELENDLTVETHYGE